MRWYEDLLDLGATPILAIRCRAGSNPPQVGKSLSYVILLAN